MLDIFEGSLYGWIKSKNQWLFRFIDCLDNRINEFLVRYFDLERGRSLKFVDFVIRDRFLDLGDRVFGLIFFFR